MTTIRSINESFISKHDFDWQFYLEKNEDLKRAGINNLESSYKHWTISGCHENRLVRVLTTGKTFQVQLKPNEKFLIGAQGPRLAPTPASKTYVVMQPNPIDLGFKIAIMVHIYDITMFPFFSKSINFLSNLYIHDNFHIFVNVVEENNPYPGDLYLAVDKYMKDFQNPNISYFFNENRGGDIGGLYLMSKYVTDLEIPYKYGIFVHSKGKVQWRKELCQAVFNINYELLAKNPEIGLVGCKKWIHSFDPMVQKDEFRRFQYHLVDLCEIYDLNCHDKFEFVAGTMFLANMEILKYLVTHQVDEVYHRLNKPNSVDINWLTLVTEEFKKDPKGCGNDLQYRIRFGKPLHPDYMIEHTVERILGLICQRLGFKLQGQ